jgi:subtilase family serine protease
MDVWLCRPGTILGLGLTAALLLVGVAIPQANALGALQNRIAGTIRSDQMQAIKGTVHPLVAVAQDQGQLDESTPIQSMSLVFRLSPAQQADLTNLLQEQQIKGSPLYHQWLKPGQFAARYGVSQQDLQKVASWLRSQGFAVTDIPASADRITFSGTAGQVNAAFHTQMHRYLFHERQGWANSTDISLPQAIATVALGVEHLNTFRPEPHVMKRLVHATARNGAAAVGPHYTLSCTPDPTDGCPASGLVNFVAPADAQTIYDVTGLYNSSITGTGQTMAVVGQTDIVQHESDIANFRSLSGLDASNLPKQIVVKNSGTATAYVGDLEEADIDTEWSGAIAKNATILYVTVGNAKGFTVFDSLVYVIQNDLAPVVSISYGGCEKYDSGAASELEPILEQANAQGQTVVASSGDSGSADCDSGAASNGLAVDYPGSSQYVTSAGGTSFSGDLTDQSKYWNSSDASDNGSAISYIPETTWNETPTLQDLQNSNLGHGQLSASGGGASSLFTKPSWQAGVGVPSDGKRDVPDISLAADPSHDGYVLCTQEVNRAGTGFTGTSCVYPVGSNQVPYFDVNDSGSVYGGTSIAAPQLAAIITLMNQEAGNTSGVGNANPILYQTAQATPAAFHDVTTGSNAVVCVAGSPNCNGNTSGYGVMSCCNAGTGYDEATGLGSVDAAALAAVWPRLAEVNGAFSLLLNPAKVSVNPGSSATTSLELSPSGAGGNSAGFTGTVNLTCSNLPAGVTCGFSNSSVSLTPGAAQTVTLTVSASSSAAATSAARLSHSPSPFDSQSPVRMAFAGILGLALLGLGRKRRYFPSRWMAVLLLAGGLMAATALTACSGGSASGGGSNGGGSTPVTQTVTVTGTSGSTVASTSIQLTVT